MGRPSIRSALGRCAVALFACLACQLPAAPHHADSPTRAEGPQPGPFMHDTRPLTLAGRRSGEGYFSADGTWMVFQSEREPGNPFYQIYEMDLESGEVERVSTGVGKTTCAWIHPGGERVLFASTHHDPQSLAKQEAELEARAAGETRRYAWDYDPAYELYEVRESGGDPLRLTNARGYDAEGSWSPDGSEIVFASNRLAYQGELEPALRERLETDPSFFIDVYIMNADGSNVRRLTNHEGYDGGPFFSPDGERIVWRRFSRDGVTAEIFSMRKDGSDVKRLTRLGVMSWAPFYHPSGDYVVFATNLHGFGNFELYAVDAQGSKDPVRVTEAPGFDGLPVFTPSGEEIVWTRRPPGTADVGSQLFIAHFDDTALRGALGIAAADAGGSSATAERDPDLVSRLRDGVERLASEEMEGRLTGTEGEQLATESVAHSFEALGLEPGGDDGSWFQAFEFTAGVSTGAGNRLETSTGASFEVDVDWRPLAFSRPGRVAPSEIVFAGYGIVAPAGTDVEAIDSYAGLDVRDRWVLLLRYVPTGLDGRARQHLQRFSSLRYKAMLARERGARGILIASGPHSKVRNELVGLAFDATLAGTSIAAISVRDVVADTLLAYAGRDLGSLQAALDAGEPVPGFVLEGVKLGANVSLQRERRTGRNVVGVLPGRSKRLAPVVIGAHVDHLGRGEATTSLARDDERNQIHFGADDNASGVAALIEIARWWSEREEPPLRDMVFAAWSGEELGLLGANHYVSRLRSAGDPHADPHGAAASSLEGRIAAYLNMDMVGRFDGWLSMYGAGSSSRWPAVVESANAPIGLPVSLQDDAYLPTDSTIFYLQGVPILSAFTGSHEDYHTPRDVAERVNYRGLADVTLLMARISRALANDPETLEYVSAPPPAQGMARAGLRVYLGTIPDYSDSDAPGLRLSGVAKGGPADLGGLREGDVIVSVDGHTVENIYDYTYSLEALQVGVETEIGIVREGQAMTLTIVPGSRD